MMRTTTLVLPFAAAMLLAAPAAAQAQPAQAGPGFGQHVSHCVKTVGFDGEHNPGMHHGLRGWDGMPCPTTMP